MNDITEIHKDIIELFKSYKIDWETNRLPMDNLHDWSNGVAELLSIDRKVISSKMTEIFWCLAHVQLSIGYSLLSRQTCQYPKGIKGVAYEEKDVPILINISEIHLFYHLNNAWESLYRCWERLSAVICIVIFPNRNEKMYFDDVVNIISKDSYLSKNKNMKSLKAQIKFWNKVSKERNRISHFESSPMKKIQLEPGVANIYTPKGHVLPKVSFSSVNLINEINKVRDNYKNIFPAVIAVQQFIEAFIKDKLNLKVI